MNDESPPRPGRRSPLVMGIILITLGALLLALNLGWGLPLALWDYWPLTLIVLGLTAVAAPTRHLSRSGGIWLLATGIYCQISVTGMFDLGWFSAWPVFVIAYGLDMIAGSSRAGSCANAKDRVTHEG
jgi:hypothetical protein